MIDQREIDRLRRLGDVEDRIGHPVDAGDGLAVERDLLPQRAADALDDVALDGVLEAVGLQGKENEVVRNLSHGEQRQLEIALALAGNPRLLLLDEPTAGLSPAESHIMTALLKKLDPTITLLVIEHDMDVAFELTDRITVLHYGKVIADGLSHEVKSNPIVQEIYLGAAVEAG